MNRDILHNYSDHSATVTAPVRPICRRCRSINITVKHYSVKCMDEECDRIQKQSLFCEDCRYITQR